MLYCLTGSNTYLLKHELDLLVAEFVSTYGDLGLERIDGEEAEIDRITGAIDSLPFLVDRKLVVVRRPSALKQFTENVEKILSEISESIDVVLYEPKLDKRLSYYKWLRKNTDFREFNEMDEAGLAAWLSKQAKQQGGDLPLSDARFLVQRVGLNQQQLQNELQKLLTYNPHVTKVNIELLVEQTPQSTIFELIESAFSGNLQRAMKLYDEQRQLKVEPQQIMGLIGWQLHLLATVKSAQGKSGDEIAKYAKLSPYVVRKTLAITNQMPGSRLKQLIADALTLDVRLKTESLDADDAVRDLICTIAVARQS